MSTSDARLSRRRVLAATASLATLAGCADTGDGTPAPTAEEEVTPTEEGEDADTPTPAEDETPDDEEEDGTPEDEGEDDSTDGGEAAETVEAHDTEFEPAFVRVDPGDTVQWEGVSGTHTVTYYHDDEGGQHRVPEGVEHVNEDLEEGDTVEATFEDEGVYDYHCIPHEGIGMVGSVVVGENDDPDQPGLSEPSDDIPEDAATRLQDLNDEARSELGIE